VTTFYMLRAVRETDLPATISNKRRVIVRAHYSSQLHELLQSPKSLFHGMPLKDLDNFIQRAEIVDYDIGTTIFRTGEPDISFGVLISGELQIRDNHANPPQVLTRLFAGDIFGIQTPLSENGLHPTTIEAILDVRIAFFDIDAWKWLQDHNPEIKSKLEQIDVRHQEQDSLTWLGQLPYEEVGVLAWRPHVISFIFGLGQPIFLLFGLLSIIFIIQILDLSNTILRYSLWGGILLLSMALIFSFVDRYIRWLTTSLILSNLRITYLKLGGLGGGTLQIIDLLRVRDVKITGKSSLISGAGNLLITTNNGEETSINHLSYVDEVCESILKQRDYVLKYDEVEQTAMTQLEIAEVMGWPLSEMKVSDHVKDKWTRKEVGRYLAQERGRPSKETPNDILQPISYVSSMYPLYFNKITLTFILSILLAPVLLPVVPIRLQLAWVCVSLGCIIWFVKEFLCLPRHTYGKDASCIYKIRRTGIMEYKIIERLVSFADIRDVYTVFPSLLFRLLNVGHVSIQIPGKEILLKNYPDPLKEAESIRRYWSEYRMWQDEEEIRRNIRKTIVEYHELQSILVESTEPVSELDDVSGSKGDISVTQ
jgi:CRP-like cAMP-binding protein